MYRPCFASHFQIYAIILQHRYCLKGVDMTANNDVQTMTFDQVAEQFFASDIGQKLRAHYAVAPDEQDADANEEFCEFCCYG